MEPRILIPVDDSPTAQKTLENVIAQKKRFPNQLTLLYVINRDQLAYRMIPDFQLEMVEENAKKSGRLLLEKAAKMLGDAGFSTELILESGTPREEITRIANSSDFHLVVIGRHEGGGEIRDVLFGSVANYVLHNVSCPVLLF
jgi:nucleotide-binding universal stress UspA family protein